MSLKNRVAPTKPVTLSDGGDPVAVRGLSLTMISEIVLVHREDAIAMFGTFMDANSRASVDDLAKAAETIAYKFPGILAHIIAVGTGDATAIDEASALPFGDQVVLLREIGGLTFTTNGGLGNVLEAVIKMLQNVNGSLAK